MPILKELSKRRQSGQSRTPQELADYANSILPKYGFEYDLDLEKVISRKIKQKAAKEVKVEGDNSLYVNFDFAVTSRNGITKKLKVTAPVDGVCCCGYSYTPVPVTKITSKEITLVIDSREFAIARPKDFPVVQEYILGEEKANLTKLRSWEVPYETHPYGVSSDGLRLYIETEIADLLLEIAEDGTLRFVPKGTKDIVTESQDLNQLPPPKVGEILRKSGELGLLRYMLNGKPYVLEFPYPCT